MWFSRYMAIILRMSLQGISSSPAAERSRNNASSAQLLSELSNGDGEIRTLDPLLARQVLSQLSYAPTGSYSLSMGLSGLEPPTSRLSGVRSNQLSYKPFPIWQPPALPHRLQCSTIGRLRLNHRVRDGYGCFP